MPRKTLESRRYSITSSPGLRQSDHLQSREETETQSFTRLTGSARQVESLVRSGQDADTIFGDDSGILNAHAADPHNI